MGKKKTHRGDTTSLVSLRAEIDECDRQIIELLARRFELAQKIGEYKAIHNLPVVDEARENKLLSDRKRQAAAGLNYNIEDIFKFILEQSRRIQTKVRKEIQSKSGRQE